MPGSRPPRRWRAQVLQLPAPRRRRGAEALQNEAQVPRRGLRPQGGPEAERGDGGPRPRESRRRPTRSERRSPAAAGDSLTNAHAGGGAGAQATHARARAHFLFKRPSVPLFPSSFSLSRNVNGAETGDIPKKNNNKTTTTTTTTLRFDSTRAAAPAYSSHACSSHPSPPSFLVPSSLGPGGGERRAAAPLPAAYPVDQQACRLRLRDTPSTLSMLPPKNNPGRTADSIVAGSTSSGSTPPAAVASRALASPSRGARCRPSAPSPGASLSIPSGRSSAARRRPRLAPPLTPPPRRPPPQLWARARGGAEGRPAFSGAGSPAAPPGRRVGVVPQRSAHVVAPHVGHQGDEDVAAVAAGRGVLGRQRGRRSTAEPATPWT